MFHSYTVIKSKCCFLVLMPEKDTSARSDLSLPSITMIWISHLFWYEFFSGLEGQGSPCLYDHVHKYNMEIISCSVNINNNSTVITGKQAVACMLKKQGLRRTSSIHFNAISWHFLWSIGWFINLIVHEHSKRRAVNEINNDVQQTHYTNTFCNSFIGPWRDREEAN